VQSNRTVNKARWTSLVAESEGSKITAAQFCRERGISLENFYMWRRELKSSRSALAPANPFAKIEVVDQRRSLPAAKWIADFLDDVPQGWNQFQGYHNHHNPALTITFGCENLPQL
jgi:hypothetical protein